MKVRELIEQLALQPADARVYVLTEKTDFGMPVLQEVEDINPSVSPTFGTAVIIELEG